MQVRILPSAKRDLRNGFEFYEKQEPGVGDYFLESLSSDIGSLRLFAGIHRQHNESFRFTSKRFPYWIYYRIDDGVAYVTAVLDARRDPRYIEARTDDDRTPSGE